MNNIFFKNVVYLFKIIRIKMYKEGKCRQNRQNE